MLKILDCTLRDGGYYTDWDFSNEIVNVYINAMNKLPVDYLEIGYRNMPSDVYMGKFAYSPLSVLKQIRESCDKKLVVMLNEKSTNQKDLDTLLSPLLGLVDMVRLAIDPKNFERALELAKAVKSFGFEVGFNTMYMSSWYEYEGFYENLKQLNGIVDIFCMVDSFGGVTPEDVKNIYEEVKTRTTCPVGFHSHNNLQLGLANTLTAIECGVDYVDATILGMGRGAGNLNMELLLTYLNKKGLHVDFNVLGEVITAFQPLYDRYKWGTSLPYMLSGANSLPQKDVMAWVTNRTYSFNSIVRALDNKKNKMKDNARYPIVCFDNNENVLLIGGGNSVVEHLEAIKEYAIKRPKMPLVFVTARYATLFNELPNKKYYCLVGNESKRLESNISKEEFCGFCILPPYPRTMGTEVPVYAEYTTYELPSISFTELYLDSCTTVGLELALQLGVKQVDIVGYDGYKGQILSEKEMSLTNENRTLFLEFKKYSGVVIRSLTPTLYKELTIKSIYQYL